MDYSTYYQPQPFVLYPPSSQPSGVPSAEEGFRNTSPNNSNVSNSFAASEHPLPAIMPLSISLSSSPLLVRETCSLVSPEIFQSYLLTSRKSTPRELGICRGCSSLLMVQTTTH